MTVQELIEALSKFSPEMEVVIWTTDGDRNIGHVGYDGPIVSIIATS